MSGLTSGTKGIKEETAWVGNDVLWAREAKSRRQIGPDGKHLDSIHCACCHRLDSGQKQKVVDVSCPHGFFANHCGFYNYGDEQTGFRVCSSVGFAVEPLATCGLKPKAGFWSDGVDYSINPRSFKVCAGTSSRAGEERRETPSITLEAIEEELSRSRARPPAPRVQATPVAIPKTVLKYFYLDKI